MPPTAAAPPVAQRSPTDAPLPHVSVESVKKMLRALGPHNPQLFIQTFSNDPSILKTLRAVCVLLLPEGATDYQCLQQASDDQEVPSKLSELVPDLCRRVMNWIEAPPTNSHLLLREFSGAVSLEAIHSAWGAERTAPSLVDIEACKYLIDQVADSGKADSIPLRQSLFPLEMRAHEKAKEALWKREVEANRRAEPNAFVQMVEPQPSLASLTSGIFPKLGLRKLIVFGNSGVGKSHLFNTLLGRPHFKSTASPNSVTRSAEHLVVHHPKFDSRFKLVLFDTPGLYEGNGANLEQNKKEIKRAVDALPGVPTGIVMVFSAAIGGRFQRQDVECFYALKNFLDFDPANINVIVNNSPTDLPNDQKLAFETDYQALACRLIGTKRMPCFVPHIKASRDIEEPYSAPNLENASLLFPVCVEACTNAQLIKCKQDSILLQDDLHKAEMKKKEAEHKLKLQQQKEADEAELKKQQASFDAETRRVKATNDQALAAERKRLEDQREANAREQRRIAEEYERQRRAAEAKIRAEQERSEREAEKARREAAAQQERIRQEQVRQERERQEAAAHRDGGGGGGCIAADSPISTAKGPVEMSAVGEDLAVLQCGIWGNGTNPTTPSSESKCATTCLAPLVLNRDGAAKEVLVNCVRTASGRSVRLTPHHHLPVARGGRVMKVPACEVQMGDCLLVQHPQQHADDCGDDRVLVEDPVASLGQAFSKVRFFVSASDVTGIFVDGILVLPTTTSHEKYEGWCKVARCTPKFLLKKLPVEKYIM